jgi:hypothetical protein
MFFLIALLTIVVIYQLKLIITADRNASYPTLFLAVLGLTLVSIL